MSAPPLEPRDRLSDLRTVPQTQYKSERGCGEARSHSVYRKNSQKRRSPSFRTPPCEREMLKSLRAKRSSLYSSTPDLCPDSACTSSTTTNFSGRLNVKQIIRNFETVGSSASEKNSSNDRLDVADFRSRVFASKNSSSIPSRSSSMRSSCLSSSFDTGFASDSSTIECDTSLDVSNTNGELRSEVFMSSTSLRLLPTTSSTLYSFHQDNPLYGSLPRIKPGARSRANITKYFGATSQVHLKRTYSVNGDIYDSVQTSDKENCAFPKTENSSVSVGIVHDKAVAAGRAEVVSVDKPVRGFATSLSTEPTSSHEVTPAENSAISNGTYSARWIHLEDLSKDTSVDDDASSVSSSSSSTLTSRSCDRSKQKTNNSGSNSSKKREKRPERRESGRFTSAAKLLRNLSRAPRDDSSTASLNRSNPNYHSEGKGLKKKNAWASERELSSSSAASKERSHSFCDKSDGKRRYSSHDEPSLTSTAPDVRSDTLPLPGSTTANEGDPPHDRLGERDCKERRSIRKLTKDSGYETSPYSELSDYAQLDQLMVPDNPTDVVDGCDDSDGDDVTLAPDSEPASDVTPSSSPVGSTPTLSRVNSRDKTASKTTSLPVHISHDKRSSEPHNHLYSTSSSGATLLSQRPETDAAAQPTEESSENRNSVPRRQSLSSLANFADALVAPSNPDTQSTGEFSLKATDLDSCQTNNLPETTSNHSIQESCSQSSLVQDDQRPARPPLPAKKSTLATGSVLTRSTPNLDEGKHGSMVTKTSQMYSYLHNGSPRASQTSNSSKMKPGRYWEGGQQDTPGREDYAHHLRSSSYQVLHSQHQQMNSGASYHARQHSNPSSYPEADDRNSRYDGKHSNNSPANNFPHYYGQQNSDRSRYFSYDSIGPESGSQKCQTSWNVSEPDLSVSNSQASLNSLYLHSSSSQNSFSNSYTQLDHHNNSLQSSPSLHKSVSRSHSSNFHPSPSNALYNSQAPPPPPPLRHSQSSASKNPSSPPPPPVRDASSLKYIKYGPGHEKFPSWPVPAGSANQVMNSVSKPDSTSQTLSESLTGPQGSHRSKSWTEQSDYPKDSSGGYTRPHHKKQLTAAYQQQLKTVMEKCERIPPQVFESKLGDDLMSNPNCSLIDSFYQSNSPYYPLYDRDGHGIDDKDYNIPSPPERDPGPSLGEANLSQVTAAQLEEYARHYDYSCSEVEVTPLLDMLREESAGWDGSSERDSGRGESESMADSFRYSNGRESVTTVVTNSSSASSSETLKWHGSLSDISLMSGHSRDTRTEQNIAHSSRVLAPQRHNSESVLYYGTEKSKKPRPGPDYRPNVGGKNSRESDSGFMRGSRDRWNREVERNNEVNSLKKFPSYSYSQPLSQINEAPAAESHENHSMTHNATSPTIDMSKPPSVAERISELERQSRNPVRESVQRHRDASEPRERTETRNTRELRRRDMSEPRKDFREDSEPRKDSDQCYYPDLGYSTPNPDSQLKEQNDSSDSMRDNVTLNSNRDAGSFMMNSSQGSSKSDQSILDQESIPLSNTSSSELERVPPLKNLSYLYPGKQGEVPEPTLKNIQKQALLSFYVRKTSSSALNEQHGPYFGKPPASLLPKNSFSSRGHVREDRSGLAGVSLARLGRVPPDGDKDSPSRPPRKRSVNGRADLDDTAPHRDGPGELHRPRSGSESSGCNSSIGQSAIVPQSSPAPPPVPPPPSSDGSLQEDASDRSTGSSRPPALPPNALDDPPPRPPERPPKKAALRSHFSGQKELPASPSFGSEDASKFGRPYYYRRPPAPDPPSADATPNFMVGQGGSSSALESSASSSDPHTNGELLGPTHLHSPLQRVPRRSFSHTVNLNSCPSSLPTFSQCSSTGAPLSPTIQSLVSQTSRSSTPDLPPPPPLESSEQEVSALADEEPLPPPPSDISRSNSKINGRKTSNEFGPSETSSNLSGSCDQRSSVSYDNTEGINANPLESAFNSAPSEDYNHSPPPPPPKTPPPPLCPSDAPQDYDNNDQRTYHKDSYMAQKKDWSSGFEGRYRRTSSPSASPIRTSRAGNSINSNSSVHPLAHHSSTKCLNSYNNYSALSSAPMLSSSTMALSYPSNSSSGSSSLSSSLSSSSSKSKSGSYLKHSASSTSSSSSSSAGSSSAGPRQPIFNSSHIKPATLDNENHVNNNNEAGWAGHARQTSTTVDFTSEALRALRSNKPTGYYQPPINRTLPSAVSTPALLQQTTYGPQASSNQGSSSSIASAPLDTPPKTSPESSLRASLDSLHSARLPLVSRTRGAHEGLPRTVSAADTLSNESFSRCTSAVESLSRSTSVADSLCRRSSSVAETPSSLSRTSSISESMAPSPTSLAAGVEGAVIARPATVTEESGIHSPTPALSAVDECAPHLSNDRESPNSPMNSPDKCASSMVNSPVPSCNSSSSSPLPTSTIPLASPTELQSGERNPVNSSISTDTTSQLSSPTPPTSEPPPLPVSKSNPEPTPDLRIRVDTVTIGYGRGRRPEEVECDQLSMEYVSRLCLDPRLQALLAPGPELKTTADYMEGVFKYEVRKDILATRSQHLIPQYESQEGPNSPLSVAPRQRNPNLPSTLNGEVTNDFKSKETVAQSRLNSQSNSNISSLSNRFSKTSLSPSSQESFSSLTNSNNYANLNSTLTRSSSSPYSPTHNRPPLSTANQVANFTSLNSPATPHDSSKLCYSMGRSLSSPEQNANVSLSSNDVSGHTSPGGGSSNDESKGPLNSRSPLPSDSAYFTSESKARLLTRMRSTEEREADVRKIGNSPTSPTSTDSQALLQKKEELMRSIGRKLDILRAEEEAIKEEIRLNNELGHEVTQRVEVQAKPQEFEKFKLHVNEIDKITSLLLGLSGRLARAENALLLLSQQDGPELRHVLELKRDRLSEQLQEAMLLKENIDRRAAQVDKSLLQYLNEAEFADYDHFSKMKAKLVMDAREISDKIKLGEEQMTALRDTFKSSEEASLSNG